MRLVRFEDESGGFAVDLHPLITVISGLPAHVRERLVHTFAALPRGTDPGGRGSIEVHGVFLELNRESLELLELNQDLDVVLRPSDLPGSELVSGDDEPDESEDDFGDEDSEVAAARRLVDEHDEAYEAAVVALDLVRKQLADAESEQLAVSQELGDARSGLDSFATAGLKVARDELEELLRATRARRSAPAPAAPTPAAPAAQAPAPVAAPAAQVAPSTGSTAVLDDPGWDPEAIEADRERIESRLSVLIEESDRLKRLMKSLRALDPEPVRRAYDALAGAGATEIAELPEAVALADQWEAIEHRLAELAQAPVAESPLHQMTARRDAAYDAYKLAERNLRQPELDPAKVERLEAIHDDIFELDGKSSRFGAAKARRRLEGLRRDESELLAELGFETWSAYIMGITSAGSDPGRRREYERAAQAYEQSEQDLADAATAPVVAVVDPEVEELEAAREMLSERVVAILGNDIGDDPVVALRAHRIEVIVGTDADPDEAAAELRRALEDTGAEVPDDLSADDVRQLTSGWLEAMDALPGRIAEAETDRDEIEGEISELAVELEALPERSTVDAYRAELAARAEAHVDDPVEEPAESFFEEPVEEPDEAFLEEPVEDETSVEAFFEEPVEDDDPEILAARARVEEGEARLAAHSDAVDRIAELETRHERLGDRLRELQDSVVEREPRVASLLEQRVAARNRLRRSESDRAAAESARWESRRMAVEEPSRFVGGAGAEAVEWYVLARLAQQRSVSFVGSVPLVIDDAFHNWPVEALGDVFTRLERMGEVIQIVYLTDDPAVGSWARGLGPDRALVLDMRVAG